LHEAGDFCSLHLIVDSRARLLKHTPCQLLTNFQTQHETRDRFNTQNKTNKATCRRENLNDMNEEFS